MRLVVYEGHCRNPVAIFNEKAVLRLGRGLQATGRLNEDGMAQAFTVLHRYHAVARAMGAQPFEVLATAAVRDARNGPDFVAGAAGAHAGRADPRAVRDCRRRSSPPMGVLCGIPTADGILADIGGGSLELVRLDRGTRGASQTLQPRRDPAGRTRRRRSGARARHRRGGPGRRCHGWPRAPIAICIWLAARGARWRASTWRRPAIRCRWCITTRSAARKRAT